MFTNILERVVVNHSNQWLLVRGESDKPLILQIQAGPGFPMISEANSLQKLHHFEDDFLVAYWDQRGVGKSFDKNEKPGNITINQLTDDLIECTRYLLKKYKKDRAILIGYSIGATISLFAAQKNPSLFSTIFLVGVDIDVPKANKSAMDFLLNQSKKSGKRKWIAQAESLEGIEINDSNLFQKRAKLMTKAGGVITHRSYNEVFFDSLKHVLFSKEYRFTDIFRVIKGIAFSQNALLPEMNKLNLFEGIKSITTPVNFIQGKLDAVAPPHISQEYFEFLDCRSKSFTEFKSSAHLPHLEEPDKFSRLVREKLGISSPLS